MAAQAAVEVLGTWTFRALTRPSGVTVPKGTDMLDQRLPSGFFSTEVESPPGADCSQSREHRDPALKPVLETRLQEDSTSITRSRTSLEVRDSQASTA